MADDLNNKISNLEKELILEKYKLLLLQEFVVKSHYYEKRKRKQSITDYIYDKIL
jgi:hypothetical protein